MDALLEEREIPVWYAAEFRTGTPVYEGIVAPQTSARGVTYPGGTGQVHIPRSPDYGAIIEQGNLPWH